MILYVNIQKSTEIKTLVYILMSYLEVREIYFYPLFISSYHFHNANMLIFVSNNIIIASFCFGIGRT